MSTKPSVVRRKAAARPPARASLLDPIFDAIRKRAGKSRRTTPAPSPARSTDA